MFLFCLLIAYVAMRLWEDGTARWRNETPPRHEYRMEKLKARENNGGRVPQSPFNRYLTGLFDDAWDSAHHKRELMAEHRKEKRERRIANKQDRQRRRWERQDAKRADKAGGDTEAQQPPAIGFDAQAPEAAQPVDPAVQPGTQPTGPATAGAPASNGSVPHNGAEPVSEPGAAPSGEVTGESWEDPITGFQVPAEATSACECGNGQQRPVPDSVHADEGDGFAMVNTECDNADCGISSSHSWTPTDEEYREYFGHGFGEDAEDEPGTDPDAKEDSTADTSLNNVIPFNRNNFTPQRMELPVTTPNPNSTGAGEVTGLASAISYAEGLSAYCTHTADQVSAIVPTGQQAVASCEQARENLAQGGTTGQALTDVASVQDQMTSAIQAINTALAQLEAAGASADSLKATLTRHQQTVGEGYAASPDAGNKQFVTAE